jgi:DNA-binding NarL/FixJ family response regulator/anti-sigma regulatory factor (Ser/Thr protein kinase)
MNAAIKVLVVDDSANTRGMLREALSMDGSIEVIGEAASGPEAVTRSTELTPDVVLMDVRMPGGGGADAAREIMSRDPGIKIVALTWSDDPESVRDMLSAGAMGYVVKGGSIDELVEAIRHASAGEAELDQKVLPAAVEDLRRLLEEETERREQVERLARAREEFVQVLSHELRTPLTVISGALHMLEGRVAGSDESPVVESALRRTAELEFLVEGLELIASGPQAEDPASAERAVASAADRLGQPPDVAFIDPSVWNGVPHRYVERVAFELLSNAFRHGSPPVEVTTYRQGRDAFLCVSDGGGWSPESSDFGAFAQGDMSNTRPQSGFGLGLFMASRLCQACDGALSIREQSGTTIAEARFRMR